MIYQFSLLSFLSFSLFFSLFLFRSLSSFLGLCLVFSALRLTRYFLDYDAFLRWFVAGCSWNARLWLVSLGMLCDGDECVLRRVEKWRSKMAIENGDWKWWSKMAIGEDGRSKRLLLLLFFLAYFLTFSLLLSILFLLRWDFLMISNVSILDCRWALRFCRGYLKGQG